MDKLHKLQALNLSHNVIERMEHLDRLSQLRDLNLANNMLTKIEGLENLILLQSLNVSNNQIKHVPPWFAKKLKALRTFRIARNNLSSVSNTGLSQIFVTSLFLDIFFYLCKLVKK